MAKKKENKDEKPKNPAPARKGLRSQDKGSNTPDPSQSAQPTPTPAASLPPKRGVKRPHAELEEEPGDGKGWLEAERLRRQSLVERAEEDASIPDFDENLQRLKDGQRDGNRRQVINANSAVGGRLNFDHTARLNKHRTRRDETALYEDFMYFQVPRRRTQYSEHIIMVKEEKNKNPFRINDTVGKLWRADGEEDPNLRGIIVSLEERNIGTLEEVGLRRRGPEELHTLIPTRRREAVGLGRNVVGQDTPAVRLDIDVDAIERRRAQIEDVQEDSDMRETHSERRVREVRRMGTEMPTRWRVNDVVPTAVSFDRTRLDSGLFIAAGETSKDWLDSYDSLDFVKPGVIAVERKLMRPNHVPSAQDEVDEDNEAQPDGPGLLNEFSRAARPHKKFKLVPTTVWTETAYGRREREHVNMFLPPPSPVESPPRSPLRKADIPTDIFSSFRNYREYQTRLRDHHGVLYRQWPKTRVEVPYGPVDAAALPKNLQAKYVSKEDVLGDPEFIDELGLFNIPTPDGTSMVLLRDAKKQPYQPPTRPVKDKQGPWPDGMSDDDEDDDPDEDDGDSSDDDGDLFRKAYLEASGVAQGGAGGAATGGNGGGNGGGTGGNGGPGNNDGGKGAIDDPIHFPSTGSTLSDPPEVLNDGDNDGDNDGNNRGPTGTRKRKRKV